MHGLPPFRADHVGSLLRPQELIEARHKLRDKALSEAELHEIEDRAIKDVIKLQEDIGLECVTDGEFRRGAFFSHFIKTVDGMTVKETPASALAPPKVFAISTTCRTGSVFAPGSRTLSAFAVEAVDIKTPYCSFHSLRKPETYASP